jgi:hypothetical protein
MEEFKKVAEEKFVSNAAVVEEVPTCILRKLVRLRFQCLL